MAAKNVKNILNQSKKFKLQEKYEKAVEGATTIRLSSSDDDDDDDVPIFEIYSKANEKFQTIEIRKKIDDELRSNARKAIKKMETKHNHKSNKKTVVSELANNVSIKIPSIYNVGTELRRMPCVISDVKYNKYQLTCQWGILEDLYGSADLEMFNGLIEFDYRQITNKISLRSAAKAASNGNRDKTLSEV